MIEDGGRAGELTPGEIILDSTSGNTGIAYAMIGAARAASSRTTRMFFEPDQYNNPRQLEGAPEIWAQTGGRSTHFVATMGTSGTAMGVGGLKERWWRQIHEHTHVAGRRGARGKREWRDGQAGGG